MQFANGTIIGYKKMLFTREKSNQQRGKSPSQPNNNNFKRSSSVLNLTLVLTFCYIVYWTYWDQLQNYVIINVLR